MLIEESISNDRPERRDAVFPADLFALVSAAPLIADANFVNAPSFTVFVLLGNLRGELRFEIETVGSKSNTLDHFFSHGLVAGFHVGEMKVAKHIGKQGD